MAGGRHLENRYDVITRGGRPIWLKFGAPTQIHMRITTKTSKWKPEVEFLYGDRLFSETGNRNISAADSAALAKFGL